MSTTALYAQAADEAGRLRSPLQAGLAHHRDASADSFLNAIPEAASVACEASRSCARNHTGMTESWIVEIDSATSVLHGRALDRPCSSNSAQEFHATPIFNTGRPHGLSESRKPKANLGSSAIVTYLDRK